VISGELIPKVSPPRVGIEIELLSLLVSPFAKKKACAQYRCIVDHGGCATIFACRPASSRTLPLCGVRNSL
jgi:hypothetical protein